MVIAVWIIAVCELIRCAALLWEQVRKNRLAHREREVRKEQKEAVRKQEQLLREIDRYNGGGSR